MIHSRFWRLKVVSNNKGRMDRRLLFDEHSREYNEVRPGYPKELIEDVIQISGIPESGSILEIGCGTGQATISFSAMDFSILCIDLGSELVRITREKFRDYFNVRVLCSSFEK